MQSNDLILKDNVLKGIEELQKSSWYNTGKEPNRDFPFPHLEYIARKEAVEIIRDLCIKQEPTVDAEPIRHGRWVTEWTGEIMIVDGVKSELGIVRCSVCGGDQGKENYEYCPHCGAKMDGGE